MYCDDCGFYRPAESECEMCEEALVPVVDRHNSEEEQSDESMWWSFIFSGPFMLGSLGAVAFSTGDRTLWLTYAACLLLYGYALFRDATDLSGHETGWTPDTTVWLWTSVLTIVLGGLPAFFVTPIYLFLRQRGTRETAV